MNLPDFLPGLKTYIAAIILAALAVNTQLHFITDPALIDLLTKLAQGLGLYGLAKKADRAVNVLEQAPITKATSVG